MKLAVFYHTILSGGTLPVNTEFACQIMHEQMLALTQSGLADAASEIWIGVNGTEEDVAIARMFAPSKAKFIAHGENSTTEIPTLFFLRSWLKTHADWHVCYHHIKGVTHETQPGYAVWRRRMEKHVIWNWRQCVADLDSGYDACGCHWLTPQKHGKTIASPFFGGTFWWSKAKHLSLLPPLPAPTWANRFEAEMWIGRRKMKVMDYHPGWP